MRSVLLTVGCLCLAGAAAHAAETGRRATIHLRTGDTLDCVVQAYADGVFQVEASGRPRTVKIVDVAKVTFGEAVGEHVRRLPEPPTTPPASASDRDREQREQRKKQFLAIIKLARLRGLVFALGGLTDRFRDTELLAKTEVGLKMLLTERRPKGQLDRNLKLSLAVILIASKRARPADHLLAALRKDYPEDPVLKELTPVELRLMIQRHKERGRGRPAFRRPRPGPGFRPRPGD